MRETPLSRGHVSSMTRARSRTLLSHSHISSLTGGCTCRIYYQGGVSVEKGSMIFRYKLAELIEKVLSGGSPTLATHCFKHALWWGVEPCSPAAMFQA